MVKNKRTPGGARFQRLASGLVLAVSIWTRVAPAQSLAPYSNSATQQSRAPSPSRIGIGPQVKTFLIGIGDSLTHGTMDATNNDINTLHAYMQLLADSLGHAIPLDFSQPLLDQNGDRIDPRRVPTNLGVDGADLFSLEGMEYYKRVGADQSFITDKYLCDKLLAFRLDDKYDKVLFPINIKARHAVSQMDGAIWLVNMVSGPSMNQRTLVVLWAGNNDSGTAALGQGGENPMYVPVPSALIAPQVTPVLRHLLEFGEERGILSFEPYTQASIERNLTDLSDFAAQYDHLIDRLETETNGALDGRWMEIALLTLPYYSSIGYLFDSEDTEFYLRKIDPDYAVPPTFQRVATPGEPITNPTQGDRISLLTFGLMYMLLDSGYSTDFVNQALEVNGVQNDGLVLSEAEQQYIAERIDGFNKAIRTSATSHGPGVHLVDIGQNLNNLLSGASRLVINGRPMSRKWTRGGAFTLDGVHPGYTGQALIANYILGELNRSLDISAPLYDLNLVAQTDPYWDRDGDGWALGPRFTTSGISELLFLLTDSDDSDCTVGTDLPPDVWTQLSRALVSRLLGLPEMRLEAARLGLFEP